MQKRLTHNQINKSLKKSGWRVLVIKMVKANVIVETTSKSQKVHDAMEII